MLLRMGAKHTFFFLILCIVVKKSTVKQKAFVAPRAAANKSRSLLPMVAVIRAFVCMTIAQPKYNSNLLSNSLLNAVILIEL